MGKRRLRKFRKNTTRAKLIALLRRGATIRKCMKSTGLAYKDCYDSIMCLHTYTGFGLNENDQGVIFLLEG